MSFSYVICHRSSTKDRDRNLSILIQYLKNNYTDIDIVLVQQDTEYKIDFPNIQNILVKQTGLFHKTRLFNIGYKKAKYDKVLFGDNDVILSKESIDSTINLLDTYETVNPYNVICDLSNEDTINYLKTFDFNILTSIVYTPRIGIVFAGGLVGFTKQAYCKIGGYDEEIVGWGAEDNVVSHKIYKVLKHYTLNGVAYHLNHERAAVDTPAQANYQNNCGFMNKIYSLSDKELLQYCEVKSRGLL